ncbi:hypothetical protein MMC27_006834 [Xylographa pallens]|nr:hypothetical protein [Xylographa pallens]
MTLLFCSLYKDRLDICFSFLTFISHSSHIQFLTPFQADRSSSLRNYLEHYWTISQFERLEMDPTPLAAAVKSGTSPSSMNTSSTIDFPPRGRILYNPCSSLPRNGFRETYRHRLFPTPSPPNSPVSVAIEGEISLSPTTSEKSETFSGGQKFSAAIASLRKLALRGSSQKAQKQDEDSDSVSDLDLGNSLDVESEYSGSDEFFDAPESVDTEEEDEPQPQYFRVAGKEELTSNEGPLTGKKLNMLSDALHGELVVEELRQRCRLMHDRLYGEYQNLDFGIHPQRSVRRSRWTRRQ